VSDSKPHDDEEEVKEGPADAAGDESHGHSESAAEPPASDDDGDEDDDFDLDDLDAVGVDGVVASMRSDDDEVAAPRRRRSPWISLGVLAVAGYLLLTMYGDFRFWMQPSQPEDLGTAAEWIGDGEVPAGYDNRYVVLTGTPDVQNAAVLTTQGGGGEPGKYSYLRITEGDGSLFAAVPRSPNRERKLEFEGRYEGRIVTLGNDRAYAWLEQFYDANDVTRTIDSSPQALLTAIERRKTEGLNFDSSDGIVHLDGRDHVSLVVRRPEARVQLGVASFTAKQAAEVVASLGYPWAKIDSPSTFHQFVVRIPEGERASVLKTLEGGLTEEPNPADPREGVAVLPMSATFTVAARDLKAQGDVLSFPMGDNSASPGFDAVEGKLVERDLAGAPMQIPAAELSAVRLDKPIELDPNGYLIEVGQKPSDLMSIGLAWLVVLGIALANLVAIGVAYRSRSR
jgi:hypothetical protein